MELTTGYTELGNERIAYQIIGDGPIDVVYTLAFVGSFDVEWEEPAYRLFFQPATVCWPRSTDRGERFAPPHPFRANSPRPTCR